MGGRLVGLLVVALLVAPSVSAASTGSKAEPVAFGRTGAIDEHWSVRVLKIFEDAREIDPSANWFNDWIDQNPAPNGREYFSVRIRITNTGKSAAYPANTLALALIADTGAVYDSRTFCGTIPGGLNSSAQPDPGESIDVNLCWVVRTKHVASVLLTVKPIMAADDEQIWFALRKSSASKSTATKETTMPTPTSTTETTGRVIPYTVDSAEDVSFAGRARWSFRMTVSDPSGYTDADKIATFVAMLHDAFRERPNAKVVVVFAYLPNTDTGGGASFGRASASSDGKGWSTEGDTLLTNQKDDGKADIFLASYNMTYGVVESESLHRVPFSAH